MVTNMASEKQDFESKRTYILFNSVSLEKNQKLSLKLIFLTV